MPKNKSVQGESNWPVHGFRLRALPSHP